MQRARASQQDDDCSNDWLQDQDCHHAHDPGVGTLTDLTSERRDAQTVVDEPIPPWRTTHTLPKNPRSLRQMGDEGRKRGHHQDEGSAANNSSDTSRKTHLRRRGCADDNHISAQGSVRRLASAAREDMQGSVDLDSDEKAVITVMPKCHETSIVNQVLKGAQVEVNTDTQESVEKVLDDITWEPMCTKLVGYMKKAQVRAGVMIHPGLTFTRRLRGEDPYGNKDISPKLKHQVRTETCLAMRLLTLAWYFIYYAIPFILMVPGGDTSETLPLMILHEFDDLRKYTRSVKLQHDKGQALTITNTITPKRSIAEVLDLIETTTPSLYSLTPLGKEDFHSDRP